MSKYQLGNKSFKSKPEIKDYCQGVVRKYAHSQVEAPEYYVLRDILSNNHALDGYDLSDLIISVGSCYFNPNNLMLYVEIPGVLPKRDISYNKAINKPNKAAPAKKGFRNEVNDQTVEFKKQYFNKNQDSKGYVRCAETGLKIKWKDAHVDHYPMQFSEILENFVRERGIDLGSVDTVSKSNKLTYLKDQELAKQFYDYHKANAEYRVVLDKVNLQRPRYFPSE